MADFNPAKYIREVRQETSKVTWPTRKETTITTIMVFVMVIVVAIFLFLVDQVIGWGIQQLLGIGG